jgi:hypothetical protein
VKATVSRFIPRGVRRERKLPRQIDAVRELRGVNRLIRMLKSGIVAGNAPVDGMVDSLYAKQHGFTSLPLTPSSIEARRGIEHDVPGMCEGVSKHPSACLKD